MAFKTLKQKIFFKNSPYELYEMIMDEKKHSKITKSEAKVSREEGGEFSVWEGSIRGKNLTLEPNKKIVQLWRNEDGGWPKDHFSRVTFEFDEEDGGTMLNFTHEGIPDNDFESVKDGWRDFYWDQMDGEVKKI